MKAYTYEDIVFALKELGIRKGDRIYVTTSLGFVGKPPEYVKNIKALCQLFYTAIMEVIGEEGNLLVPCFSYTFGKGHALNPAVFDPKQTKSEIGPFPSFVASLPESLRSADPMLSVCSVGRHDRNLLEIKALCSYCEGSFLSRLVKSDAKFVNIGIGYKWMPFIHYIDWLLKVPYRYEKVFNGIVIGEFSVNAPWAYYSRALIEESNPAEDEVAYQAYMKGIFKQATLGNIRIYSCSVKEYFDFSLELSKGKAWILAKGPECDVLEKEKKRTGVEVLPQSCSLSSEDDLISCLITLRRDLMTDSYEKAVDILIDYMKLESYEELKTKTGESVMSYIVPERWVLRDFSLTKDNGKTILKKESSSHNSIFGHSIPYGGWLSVEELKNHILLSWDGRAYFSTFRNRYWGFSLIGEEFEEIKSGKRFFVNIDADFSYGELTTVEKFYDFGREKTIAFISYLDGPYMIDEHISGVLALKRLKDYIQNLKRFNFNISLVLTAEGIGFCSWVNHAIRRRNLTAVVILKNLGNSKPFSFLVNDRSFLKHRHTYLFDNSYFYGVGNNPLIEKIEYPSIKVLQFSRTCQPFTHSFKALPIDTDTSIDKNALEESVRFLNIIVEELNERSRDI